jgi:phosphatidylglycerophosphate synthase
MRIWIDATQPECQLRVFGMTLLERRLRGIAAAESQLHSLENIERKVGGMLELERHLCRVAETKIRPSEIWIELPPDSPDPNWIPEDLLSSLPIRWMREPGSTRERLQRALRDANGEALLAFAGDSVVDDRLFDHLAWWPGGSVAFISDEGPESAAAMRLEAPLREAGEDEVDLLDIATAAIESGDVKRLQVDDFESYIRKLRRLLAPFLFRVRDQPTAAKVERFLFQSNYKGSTDFLTKWVYPPIVWRLLKPLTARRVHPNWVTGLGILLCFGAVPFFAAGMWWPGMIMAYAMSVLDSVDGKLARVTFTSTPQGDVLDHGTDIIHPPFWYWGWALGLAGGDPYSPVFQASLWLTVFYILDRVMEMLFKSCTGQSIHGYTPLDVRMRTFVSRRNVNLAVFTVALAVGMGTPAFYLIAAWQAVTLLFHVSRVIKFWNDHDNRAMRKSLGIAPR